MLGGAGYAAMMAVFFLSVALWWALGFYLTGLGWSAVIVAVIWGVIALVLFMTGRKQLKSVEGAPRTVESVKRIPDAVKRNEENR
jgi:hypothetical protein